MGVEGDEQVDSHARQGAKAAKHAVTAHKSAQTFGLTWGCKKCRTLMTQTQMRWGAHVCLQTVNLLQTGLRTKDRKFLIPTHQPMKHSIVTCMGDQLMELMVGDDCMPVIQRYTVAEYPALHSPRGPQRLTGRPTYLLGWVNPPPLYNP